MVYSPDNYMYTYRTCVTLELSGLLSGQLWVIQRVIHHCFCKGLSTINQHPETSWTSDPQAHVCTIHLHVYTTIF